jgi:hypothetical protein
MNTKTWIEIKDAVYGEKETERRDELDRDFELFKIGLLLKKAREEKTCNSTQSNSDICVMPPASFSLPSCG